MKPTDAPPPAGESTGRISADDRPLPPSVTRADRQRMLDKHPPLKAAAEAWERR